MRRWRCITSTASANGSSAPQRRPRPCFRPCTSTPAARFCVAAAATNVTRLRVFGADAESLPERLLARGIAIRPALHASPEGAEFELFTNETILRRPTAEIVETFIEALGPSARPSILTLSGLPLT